RMKPHLTLSPATPQNENAGATMLMPYKILVQVEFNDGVLSVSGQRPAPEQVEGRQVHRNERRWGNFQRSVKLPEVDGERISAEFKHGVLLIVAPKLAAATSRKIEVKLG
ncbi:MAG: Hsp20/alpha crystallin family protein, partial [Planctomycetota bacterium]